MECGDFYRLEHNIEAIREVPMPGSGEPFDFVFETHRIGLMKNIPVANNRFLSPFHKRIGWETVTLVPVYARVGGEQVPEVIVAPKGERQYMIHVESPTECSACPDTYLGIKVTVSPPGVVDITFAYGCAQ